MQKDAPEAASDFLLTVTAKVLDHRGQPVEHDFLQADNPQAAEASRKLGRSLKRLFSGLAKAPPPPTFLHDLKKARQKFLKDSGMGLKLEMTLKHKKNGDKVTLPL